MPTFGVVVDALHLDDRLRFLETVEDLAIEAFIPELLCRSGFLTGNGNRLALCLQHLNLAKLRHDLVRRKSLPGHVLSPFQFDTLTSSGSEKAGQVRCRSWSKTACRFTVPLPTAAPIPSNRHSNESGNPASRIIFKCTVTVIHCHRNP